MNRIRLLSVIASIVLIAILFSSAGCSSQGGSKQQAPDIEWSKTFGGSGDDGGSSVQQTSDGGFIIAGGTESFGAVEGDVYLIKTDASGNEQWSKTFGGSGDDRGESVQQTSDGGFVIVGGTSSSGSGGWDMYLIKTDASGNQQWSKTFGGSGDDRGESVQQTSDGGFVIVGTTASSGTDVYLIKTDASGNQQWSKTFGGSSYDDGQSVQQTSDGGFVIAGTTASSVYLIKTDASGNQQWSKTFGGSDMEGGYSVRQTSDGGFVIAGAKGFSGAGGQDVYLIKTDVSGDQQWSKTFGGSGHDLGESVQQTSDGGFVIAGHKGLSGAGGVDGYLIKTDASGNEQWSKTFGGSGYDGGQSVQQTSDGGFIVVGGTYSSGAGESDVYLVKISATATQK